METLFERHQEYLSDTPTSYVRTLMDEIDWESPLLMIRGPKGVGKSTLIEENPENSALALDDIDIASPRKIPLWAFGMLY